MGVSKVVQVIFPILIHIILSIEIANWFVNKFHEMSI